MFDWTVFPRLILSASLAVSAGLGGFLASPASAASACVAPSLYATIDVSTSKPYAPHIVLRVVDLALPATGHFEWGDGRFGIARIDSSNGGLDALANIKPDYQKAGTYTLALTVTDTCRTRTMIPYVVTVPLQLPSPASLTCPTPVDQSGTCIVPLGAGSTVAVAGGPPGADWQWSDGGTSDAVQSTGHADSIALDPTDTHPVRLQASARTPAGWVVTPVLQVLAIAPRRPRITAFTDAGTTSAGQSFDVGFTVPPGSGDGMPSIYVDDQKVADGASATLTLAPGSHTVGYVLTYPDGGVIQRQTIVVANGPAVPAALLEIAAIGLLALALIALLLHVRRSRPIRVVVATGSALGTALPALPAPRSTPP